MGARRRAGTDGWLHRHRCHLPPGLRPCTIGGSRSVERLGRQQSGRWVAGRQRPDGCAPALHDRTDRTSRDESPHRAPRHGATVDEAACHRAADDRAGSPRPASTEPGAARPDTDIAGGVIGWFVSDGARPRALLAVLGTTGVVVTAEPSALAAATCAVLDEIDAIDRACSRFRADSDLARANGAAGEAVEVSPVMLEAVDVAAPGRRAHRRRRRPDGGSCAAGPRLRPRLLRRSTPRGRPS